MSSSTRVSATRSSPPRQHDRCSVPTASKSMNTVVDSSGFSRRCVHGPRWCIASSKSGAPRQTSPKSSPPSVECHLARTRARRDDQRHRPAAGDRELRPSRRRTTDGAGRRSIRVRAQHLARSAVRRHRPRGTPPGARHHRRAPPSPTRRRDPRRHHRVGDAIQRMRRPRRPGCDRGAVRSGARHRPVGTAGVGSMVLEMCRSHVGRRSAANDGSGTRSERHVRRIIAE